MRVRRRVPKIRIVQMGLLEFKEGAHLGGGVETRSIDRVQRDDVGFPSWQDAHKSPICNCTLCN